MAVFPFKSGVYPNPSRPNFWKSGDLYTPNLDVPTDAPDWVTLRLWHACQRIAGRVFFCSIANSIRHSVKTKRGFNVNQAVSRADELVDFFDQSVRSALDHLNRTESPTPRRLIELGIARPVIIAAATACGRPLVDQENEILLLRWSVEAAARFPLLGFSAYFRAPGDRLEAPDPVCFDGDLDARLAYAQRLFDDPDEDEYGLVYEPATGAEKAIIAALRLVGESVRLHVGEINPLTFDASEIDDYRPNEGVEQ